ncbi:transmembrane protein 234 homolog isoform X1 [Schistocerca gregaria]|uniref:transmembrane protein 234 homolog isoform X1 n=2 Tax=Schistocerca gregaria TaxID=7010 RepID=UPI00211E9D12|nr:transmembrane protein 234 homolog isoform X1 [Schistocerca gregaria]
MYNLYFCDTASVMSLVVAAVLWGCTNPFIKKGSSGVEDISEKSSTKKFFKEIKFLLSNWKYMTPFLLNQSGSLFYFLALQNTEMSLAVPVANSLTFVFTAVTGWILGESLPNAKTVCGITLIVCGISLCCVDKFLIQNEGGGAG